MCSLLVLEENQSIFERRSRGPSPSGEGLLSHSTEYFLKKKYTRSTKFMFGHSQKKKEKEKKNCVWPGCNRDWFTGLLSVTHLCYWDPCICRAKVKL